MNQPFLEATGPVINGPPIYLSIPASLGNEGGMGLDGFVVEIKTLEVGFVIYRTIRTLLSRWYSVLRPNVGRNHLLRSFPSPGGIQPVPR